MKALAVILASLCILVVGFIFGGINWLANRYMRNNGKLELIDQITTILGCALIGIGGGVAACAALYSLFDWLLTTWLKLLK